MKLPFHLSALLLAGVFLVLVGCGGGSEDQSPAPSPRPSPAATGQPGRFNGPVTNLSEAADGSGEIYVAGLFTTYNDQPVRPVVRVKQDGTLNPAFVLDNSIRPFINPLNQIASIAPAQDGSNDLYVGEVSIDLSGTGQGAQFFSGIGRVWRVHPSGTINPAFQSGEVTWAVPFVGDRLVGSSLLTIVLVDNASGRIYVGGLFDRYNGTQVRKLARVHANGTLDSGFTPPEIPGVGIDLVVPAEASDIYVTSIVQISPSAFASQFLHRLKSDGSLDPAFNAGTSAQGTSPSSTITTVVPVNDGSGDLFVGGGFLTFGSLNPNTHGVQFLARLNPDGTLDRNSPKPEVTEAVTLLAKATDGTGDWFVVQRQRLSRFKANGTLDPQFATGQAQGDVESAIGTVLPSTDGSGDFYVGGEFSSYNGAAVGNIVRINKDGSLD